MRRLLVVILIAWMVSGCAAPVKDTQKSPPVITLWYSWQGDAAKGLELARQELAKTKPPYTLELIYVPGDIFNTRLSQAQAADKGPDLWLVDQGSIPALVDSGSIQPVDLSFDPSFYFQSAVQAVSWNGGIIAVPRAIRVPLLAYNKDLVPNPPAAWEQILDQTGKITKGQALGMAGDLADPFLTSSLYSAYGAGFFTADQRPDLNNAASLAFLGAVAGQPSFGGSMDPQVARNLMAGATPFALLDSRELGGYKALGKNLGFAVIPGPGGKEGKSYVRVDAFVLSAYSNFAKEATAAAVFLTSPLAMGLYASADFPAQIDPYGQKPLLDNTEAQLVKRLAAGGVGWPQDVRTTTLITIVQQMIKDTLVGTEPALAAQAAQDRAIKALGTEP